MATDDQDLKCSQAEHDAISASMAGVSGFDPNVVPWKQVGNDFYLIPEAIPPGAVLLLVKYVLSHP